MSVTQQSPITISIDAEGTTRFLLNERTSVFTSEASVIRRASHVEPVSPAARWLFHTLRSRFGEKGWMASFTRRWPCWWRVNLAPIGGKVLPYAWRDRQQAIEHEIKHLNQTFI